MRVRFGSFEFDTATRELLDAGRPVHLSPKSFDLLQVLVERRPALVTKTELQDRLWPNSVVLEANLGNAVAEIRKALGDDSRSPTFVWTVSRRGYRFSADVEMVGAADPGRAHGTVRWWLVWKDTILPLAEGDNVVGRNPNSGIWINAASVSRVHAHIAIAGGRAVVEDRRSTNGTYVNGVRIASRHPLVDGTTVMFGSEETVFREWSDTAAPATEPVRSRTKPIAI
jgi:DNA-binding winged helix-turn-helix (wHTH) protein